MIDVALINLIATGLVKLANTGGDTLPAPASAASDLIRDLMESAPEPTSQLIEKSVADIWSACGAVGLPASLAEPHLAALPGVIAAAELHADDLDKTDAQDTHLMDLATVMVDAASPRFAADPDDAIDTTVLGYLLGTFLGTLAASPTELNALLPLARESLAQQTSIQQAPTEETSTPATAEDATEETAAAQSHDIGDAGPVTAHPRQPDAEIAPQSDSEPADQSEDQPASGPATEPAVEPSSQLDAAPEQAFREQAPQEQSEQPPSPPSSKASATLAKIERADALGIPVAVLDIITVGLINHTRSAEIRHDDLADAAERARHLGEALAKLPDHPQAGIVSFTESIGHFRAGRLTNCDRALATAEDELVRRSISTVPDAGLPRLATEIRLLRAELQALQCAFVKSARHYGFAQRYIKRTDCDNRWRLAEREAHYYELAAFHRADPSNLDHAARACTNALASMPQQSDSLTRALAQATLARLLVILGDRDATPERYELAVQLLADAATMFKAAGATDDLLATNVIRAAALARLGERFQQSAPLQEAVSIYQSALAASPANTSRPASVSVCPGALTGLKAQCALAVAILGTVLDQPKLTANAVAMIEETLADPLGLGEPAEPDGAAPAYNRSAFDSRLLFIRCHLALLDWHDAAGREDAATAHRATAEKACAALGFDMTTMRAQAPSGTTGSVAGSGDPEVSAA